MRKKLISLIFATCCSWSYATGLDFIVMVDTSESMISHFDDLIPYLFENIINRSRVGDSVHLLTFHSNPELIAAQPVLEESSYDELLNHLLLLQPVGPYTNLVRASEFLLNYSRSLLTNNQKNIIFITDGIHDPHPDTTSKLSNPQEITSLINSNINKIIEEGWLIKVVKLESEPDQNSALSSALFFNKLKDEIGHENIINLDSSQAINSKDSLLSNEYLVSKTLGMPTLSIEREMGNVGRRLSLPILIQNHNSEPIIINLKAIQSNNVNLLTKPVTSTIEGVTSTTLNAVIKLPQEIKAGPHSLLLEFSFSPDIRIVPKKSYINFTLEKDLRKNKLNRKTLVTFLISTLALSLFVTVFVLLRSFLAGSQITRTISDSLKNNNPQMFPESLVSSLDDQIIEMRVEFQNTRIGNRNIKSIRPGATLTIGGGINSSFLIFLYPFPQRIGELTYNGDHYMFTPTLIDYFPQLDGPLHNCLDKDIVVNNLKGHQVTFKFIKFYATLDKINALMRSISKPTYNS